MADTPLRIHQLGNVVPILTHRLALDRADLTEAGSATLQALKDLLIVGAGATVMDDLTDVDTVTIAPTEGQVLAWDDAAGLWEPVDLPAVTRVLTFGYSGELVVGALPIRLYAPVAGTIVGVLATVGTAPTGASVIVDIHKNGTTIFTTQGNRPTIVAGSQDDLTSVPDVTAVGVNDLFTLDVDQVGSTIIGSDLVVQIRIEVTP